MFTLTHIYLIIQIVNVEFYRLVTMISTFRYQRSDNTNWLVLIESSISKLIIDCPLINRLNKWKGIGYNLNEIAESSRNNNYEWLMNWFEKGSRMLINRLIWCNGIDYDHDGDDISVNHKRFRLYWLNPGLWLSW